MKNILILSFCVFSFGYSLLSYIFFSHKYVIENFNPIATQIIMVSPSPKINLSANINPFSKKTKCIPDFKNKKVDIKVNPLKILNLSKEEKEAEIIYIISQCSYENLFV